MLLLTTNNVFVIKLCSSELHSDWRNLIEYKSLKERKKGFSMNSSFKNRYHLIFGFVSYLDKYRSALSPNKILAATSYLTTGCKKYKYRRINLLLYYAYTSSTKSIVTQSKTDIIFIFFLILLTTNCLHLRNT